MKLISIKTFKMAGFKFNYENKVWGGEILRKSPAHFRAARLRLALKSLEKVTGKVLDVGCGVGDFSEAIKFYRPDLEIYGVDISQKAIEIAKKRIPQTSFIIADAQQLPFENDSFDAVLCFDLIEHVRYPEKVIKEIYRVLKPKGIFHSHVPIEDNLWSLEGIFIKLGWKGKEIYGGHPHHFTFKKVKTMFENENFKILKYHYGDHFFHQLLEIGYFSWLSLRGKNVGNTVEGYLGLSRPSFKIKIIRGVKDVFAIITYIESKILWWYPGIGVHVTCVKK